MTLVLMLLLFPLVIAAIILFVRNRKATGFIVIVASLCVAALAIVTSIRYFNNMLLFDLSRYNWLYIVLITIECAISGYLIYIGIKNRRKLTVIFSIIQVVALLSFEYKYSHLLKVVNNIMIDKLAILMILIIGVIGGLICMYANTYMKDYHKHHPEVKDRSRTFFALLFIFLSAMFGLVISNDLMLLLFCWEITTFCSFLLIGYTRTDEAKANSFKALEMNLFGGLAFLTAIIIIAENYHVLDLISLISLGSPTGGLMLVPLFLFGLAGLTKSAQMPFSRWLLGAMVAPTPSSALLHSSTMVKAGIYLIIRLSPMMQSNAVGISLTIVGAFSFLVTALLAASQSDAKKVLAYSTISNLGLIIVCAGIGTADALWAAIMLIIFHAVAKSLLFLAVGSAEHQLGSRNIEDMDAFVRISPKITLFLIVGIAGMFLAPFGMLISKWAAMKAFMDANNFIVVIAIAFGSSITLFFWTKWLGKLVGKRPPPHPDMHYRMTRDESIPMYVQSALTIGACLAFPFISQGLIIPYLDTMFPNYSAAPISNSDSIIIAVMVLMLIVIPLTLFSISRGKKRKVASIYMAGENTGDNVHFRGGMGRTEHFEHRNWYLGSLFKEKPLLKSGTTIAVIILVASALWIFGGALL